MSKLVAKGRFKVLFDEYGDIERLEIDGEVYEGFGFYVPIPYGKVADVRLGEIPEGVLLEPAEKVEETTVYPLSYGGLFFYEVHYGNGYAYVNVTERRKFWEGYIGLDAYAKALEEVLDVLAREGIIEGEPYTEWDGDYYNCQFIVPLDPDLTIGEAVEVMRSFLEALDEAVRRVTAEIVAPLLDELGSAPPLQETIRKMKLALKAGSI